MILFLIQNIPADVTRDFSGPPPFGLFWHFRLVYQGPVFLKVPELYHRAAKKMVLVIRELIFLEFESSFFQISLSFYSREVKINNPRGTEVNGVCVGRGGLVELLR